MTCRPLSREDRACKPLASSILPAVAGRTMTPTNLTKKYLSTEGGLVVL